MPWRFLVGFVTLTAFFAVPAIAELPGHIDAPAGRLSRPDAPTQDARAVPYFRDGILVGVRFFAIQHGSFWETIGVRTGDILINVDDLPIGSDPDFEETLSRIRRIPGETHQFLIERNRKPITLRFISK